MTTLYILLIAAIAIAVILAEVLQPSPAEKLRRQFKKLDAKHEKLKREIELVYEEKSRIARQMFSSNLTKRK